MADIMGRAIKLIAMDLRILDIILMEIFIGMGFILGLMGKITMVNGIAIKWVDKVRKPGSTDVSTKEIERTVTDMGKAYIPGQMEENTKATI